MSELQLQGLISINNSTMRRQTETSCSYSERKTTITRKGNVVKNRIKMAKAALPAACVVVAGPAISCLPLGPLASMLAILTTSLASTYLDRKAIGIAVVLVQGCGLRGFEGRVLALLSFLSFSSTFEKLGKPLRFSYMDLLLVIGIVQSAFAGSIHSTYSGLLGFLQAMALAIYKLSSNTLMLASQYFNTSWIKTPPFETSKSPLELLAQTLHDSHTIESHEDYDGDSSNPKHKITSNMSEEAESRYPPTKLIHEASSEDPLANRESTKEHEAEKGSCSNDMERGDQTLSDEVIRLIYECDGNLSPEEWDEIIAGLD
ncbi:hypothetical protein yc1106_08481 [Curvularia clavata]|uniref:Uncharacterized protein n=1 Tax=Curvularia clavata TaxID=95742 RepID=A0A9Q8ZDD8_CURCL|nr:hypothetical protein yc1106_08481 [Curvularia clavata]